MHTRHTHEHGFYGLSACHWSPLRNVLCLQYTGLRPSGPLIDCYSVGRYATCRSFLRHDTATLATYHTVPSICFLLFFPRWALSLGTWSVGSFHFDSQLTTVYKPTIDEIKLVSCRELLLFRRIKCHSLAKVIVLPASGAKLRNLNWDSSFRQSMDGWKQTDQQWHWASYWLWILP